MMAVPRWLALLLTPFAFGSSFEQDVRPFLDKHCTACHGEQMQMAELRLDSFAGEEAALRRPEVWLDVLRVTRAGKMPPPGGTQPSPAELAAVSGWIEGRRQAMAAFATVRPGRVTARRLNRGEYNNTVRDLLGVDLRPADSFPVDDSGYGFDNNGDVLSISPLLMEKYVEAAGRLARAAVWDGPRLAEPTRFRVQARRDESNADAIGRVAPFTADGSLRVRYRFPAQGFYEFAFGATDRRQRSEDDGRYLPDMEPPPPLLMTMAIDGRRMATKAVEAAQYFDRSERVRHLMQPGESEVWLGFIGFDGQPLNPNQQFRQRKVWVDYIEINGPFDADPVPPPASQRRVLTCRPSGEEPWEPCAEQVVRGLLRRAYRRSPEPEEINGLMRLAKRSMEGGDSFEGMARTVLQSVLVSPNFLFRIERGSPAAPPDGARAIRGFELASRLSYFLWSSMPDDELLDAAESGRLDTDEGLRRQVSRLIEDGRSSALVENFAGQWLQLRNLALSQPDAKRFPNFDEQLRAAMLRETQLYFERILREDRSVLDFLDSDFSYLNGRLAAHYGIHGVTGDEFRRVRLPDDRRGGLLGQASVLTIASYPTRTSPVLRGLWVLENILGQKPPPPPPDVPELEVREGELVGTLREQLEAHRDNEGCMSCHLVMDAIGFGLENYDAIGKWRDTDGAAPVDAAGTLPGELAFETPAELRRILRETEADSFSRTLTKKLLTYALGRGVGREDNPAVNGVLAKLKAADYRVSALIEGVIDSLPFRMSDPDRAAEPSAGDD